MTYKNQMYLVTYLSLPFLLFSFGSGLTSETTSGYVNSNVFLFSLLVGALVTTGFYVQYVNSKGLKIILVSIFGILVPLLHSIFAQEVYSSNASKGLYALTGLIGLVEIILYLGIFLLSIFDFLKYLITPKVKR